MVADTFKVAQHVDGQAISRVVFPAGLELILLCLPAVAFPSCSFVFSWAATQASEKVLLWRK